jgi:sec-independent protein translocase protein TatC
MALVPFPSASPSPRDSDDEELQDDDGAGGKMSFLEHLDELRKRIVNSLIALCVGIAIAAFFIDDIYAFVMLPLRRMLRPGETLIYTYPTEAFMLYLRIAIIAGLFVAAPLIFWQVWLFVAPALYSKERRYAIPFIVLSSAGVVAGAAFSHYVAFPLMWRFFASFSNEMVSFMPRIEDAFSLYIRMLLGMAVVFQMPALVFFLARMGVVTARWMIRQFKYAVLMIVILAAVITPSSDIASQLIVAAPMLVLYVLSIGIAAVVGKKRQPAE